MKSEQLESTRDDLKLTRWCDGIAGCVPNVIVQSGKKVTCDMSVSSVGWWFGLRVNVYLNGMIAWH